MSSWTIVGWCVAVLAVLITAGIVGVTALVVGVIWVGVSRQSPKKSADKGEP